MTVKQFDTPGRVSVRVKNRSGEIRLIAHDQPTTEVELIALDPAADEVIAQTSVDGRPDGGGYAVEVDVPSEGAVSGGGFLRRVMSLAGEGAKVRVVVHCPTGTTLDISSASADVEASGTFGTVKAKTASGDLTFDHIEGAAQIESASGDVSFATIGGTAKLESVSGDVRGERIAGTAKAHTASGDVMIDIAVERISIETVSGDVRVGEAATDCQVKTTSGDISVGKATRGDVTLHAVSGDLKVGVAAGSLLHVEGDSVSGDLRSEIPLGDAPPDGEDEAGPELHVQVKTVSGDAVIRRA